MQVESITIEPPKPPISDFINMWKAYSGTVKDIPIPTTDIILIRTAPGLEGKMKLGGKMRTKKRRFIKALHQVPISTTIYKDCYPTAVGGMEETPDSNIVNLNVSFDFKGMTQNART